MPRGLKTIYVAALFGGLLVVDIGRSHAEPTIHRQTERGGLHFQVALGWAGGPTSNGLLHNMEIGGTFSDSGITITYDHVWVLSDGLGKPDGGSDMFGGHMLALKLPLFTTRVVGRLGAGLGENVDLSDGFDPSFGIGWIYGVDWHLPLSLSRKSAPTLGLIAFHAITEDAGHQWAGGLLLGYTWY